MHNVSRICVGLMLVSWEFQAIQAQSVSDTSFNARTTIAARTVMVVGDVPPPIASAKVRDLVAQILDDRISATKRQELIKRNPAVAGDLIAGLTDQLTPGT
ncbi:MAG: hypothetical protein JWN70_5228, partial [Planctomycetaceae bacterium]|nr:hypothetical protein [Planctomycetaceae bacterium]